MRVDTSRYEWIRVEIVHSIADTDWSLKHFHMCEDFISLFGNSNLKSTDLVNNECKKDFSIHQIPKTAHDLDNALLIFRAESKNNLSRTKSLLSIYHLDQKYVGRIDKNF